MKVAIYKKDGTYATVLEGINNPKLTDTQLTFDNGSISGFDQKHVLLDNETEIPATIEEARTLDQREKYKVEKVDHIAELKVRQDLMQQAIDDLILGGMM